MILRVVCLGDVVGRSGRACLSRLLPALRRELSVDLVIANGENAAGGVGLDPGCAEELKQAGVDFITLGDHVWQRRPLQSLLTKREGYCLRPANFSTGAPGQGWAIWEGKAGFRVGIFNLLGRIFLNVPLDCPFRTADALLAGPLGDCQLTICDMHAEATSEKIALARYLDGRASLVFGTHTHVATADEGVLPGGTGYITDLGMCGPIGGVIGMDPGSALERFLTGVSHRYELAGGPAALSGIVAELDVKERRCVSIQRIRRAAEDERSG